MCSAASSAAPRCAARASDAVRADPENQENARRAPTPVGVGARMSVLRLPDHFTLTAAQAASTVLYSVLLAPYSALAALRVAVRAPL